MSEARATLFRGTRWAGIGQVVTFALTIAAAAQLGRQLGFEDFGRFAALQGAMLISVGLWDLGGTVLVGRQVAAHHWFSPDAILSWARARLLTSPIFLVAVLLAGWAASAAFPLAVPVLLAVAALLRAVWTVMDAACRSRREFAAASSYLLTGRLTFNVLLLFSTGTTTQRAVFAAGSVALAELVSVSLHIGRLVWIARTPHIVPGKVPGVIEFLRTSLPFAGVGMINLAYNKIDVPLVGVLGSPTALAEYAPASRIQDALSQVPAVASSAMLPALAASPTVDGARDTVRTGIRLALLLAIPAVAIVVIFAGQIVAVLFGPGFSEAALPTRIIALAVIPTAMTQPLVSAGFFFGRGTQLTRAFSVGLVFALIGYVAVVPWGGAVGAAVVTVFREVVTCAGCLFVVNKTLRA